MIGLDLNRQLIKVGAKVLDPLQEEVIKQILPMKEIK
jgi:hypothetical protein